MSGVLLATYFALSHASTLSYLLFADDDASMRKMVRDMLSASGYDVGLAWDGPSALAQLNEKEPDLLILDLEMPGISGFDVCRMVKANPLTSQIPVLLLTGQGGIDYKVEGFEAGADDFLAKPFDVRELRARVSALLRLVRRESDRNPTSGLPGGRAIEANIVARIEAGDSFVVCYADIDNFKAFADHYGFSMADDVIRRTGDAMRRAISRVGVPEDFVGHIGGDDFLVVTEQRRAVSIAKECAREFKHVIAESVGEEAMARGMFRGSDRSGVVKWIPLAHLSVAIIPVSPDSWVSAAALGARAAESKRKAKHRGPGTILLEGGAGAP